MNKKAERQKRRLMDGWWVITDKLQYAKEDCADLLGQYFDDSIAKARIRKEYKEKRDELMKQRDQLRRIMEAIK